MFAFSDWNNGLKEPASLSGSEHPEVEAEKASRGGGGNTVILRVGGDEAGLDILYCLQTSLLISRHVYEGLELVGERAESGTQVVIDDGREVRVRRHRQLRTEAVTARQGQTGLAILNRLREQS